MNKEFTRKKVNIHREECHICGPHPPNRVVLLNKFWGQRGCAEHFKDGTLRCYACNRFKEREIKYVEVDGQQLCSYCYSITIMDPEDCKLLIFENVRRFYASIDLNVDEDIPILLVDRDEMIKFKNEKTETIPVGMAIFNYCTPIMTINRCTKYEDRIKVEKKANKVNKLQLLAALFCCGQRQMIRLLLQFGWPDVLMGMALAHEMMHAWLSLQGLIGGLALERWVEEGICEVMSHKYGQWYCSRDFDNTYETKEQFNFRIYLYQYRAELMKIRPDEIYGKGFNQVMQAVEEYGFQTTLDHIVAARCLPHVCTNSK